MPLRLPSSLTSTATRRLNLLTNALRAPHPPSRPFTMTTKTQEPIITSIDDLPLADARWITLKKISYTDQTGKARTWEVATRKTRSEKAGVDAVAMGNILLPPPSQKATRPASTLLDAETAAVREFHEETGYEVSKVLSVSPPQAADPGMTNANMQLVMVEVQLPEGGEGMPEQRLEDGEHITRVVVPLADLYKRLVEYAGKERHIVAAKLLHFAQGMEFMKEQQYF
ncbi:ADP-ribose pyrophosphatase [Diaporthe sp. PMI_573]|nr:ADP-ribose pyrophosphatase [Diaporthaceae sp. PMI_573]